MILCSQDNLLTYHLSWNILEDNYITLSLLQSLLNGCSKEVLNHNKHLQLGARW